MPNRSKSLPVIVRDIMRKRKSQVTNFNMADKREDRHVFASLRQWKINTKSLKDRPNNQIQVIVNLCHQVYCLSGLIIISLTFT